MRVNVYAEEMSEDIEIISKEIDGHTFTGLRIYLYLPVSAARFGPNGEVTGYDQLRGKFIHRPGDDDSSAVTFWGKRDLRDVLMKAIVMLNRHYAEREMGKAVADGLAALPIVETRSLEDRIKDGDAQFMFRIFQWAWSWVQEMQGQDVVEKDEDLIRLAKILSPDHWQEIMKEGS